MTHLGKRAQALVDGRLAPDAAERANAHLAGCDACRQEVAAQRALRDRLRSAAVPEPPADLVAGLLALGGPQGPLPPRRPRPPGAAAHPPAAPWAASRRPPGRTDGGRPATRRARRLAAGAAGVLAVACVGVLGLLLLGTQVTSTGGGAPVARGAGGAAASTSAARAGVLGIEQRAGLRAEGWLCPEALPGGLRLVSARAVHGGAGPTLELTYSDGTSTVTVLEQRGRVDEADAAAFSQAVAAGARSGGSGRVPWHGLWQSGDVVVGVVADAPPELLDRALPALAPQHAPAGWWERVERGAATVTALFGGR